MSPTASGGSNGDVYGILRQPFRRSAIRYIADLESPISPSDYVRNGGPGFGDKPYATALSFVSYHFRVLHKAGVLELVALQQRRGTNEHLYRLNRRRKLTADLLAQLAFDQASLTQRADD